jgi:uncharacterized membrane protein YkoI
VRRSRGELKSLAGVLMRVRHRYGGRILDVRLAREGRRHVYRIKLLDRLGHLREISIPASRQVRTNFRSRARAQP